jgi:probable F420-dependent oxidoreductase
MKIGAVYPQIELGGAPEAFDKIGRAVEDMGLDHLVMYDHVVGAVHEGREPPLWGPYTENDPFHDPFVAFGYLAAITKRIKMYTGVLILPQRQTVLVAKQATDVELLSGGRFVLGVGIGWNYVEYDALGYDFTKRGKRMDEQIPYLRRLWNEHAFSFDGQFDSIDRGNIIPRPRTQIPIFAGGLSDPAYRRAARLCDGFMFGGLTGEALREAWTNMRGYVKDAGRSVEDFVGHTYLMSAENFGGADVQAAADMIREWEDMGGTEVSIVSMGRGFKEVDQHIDHYQAVLAKAR